MNILIVGEFSGFAKHLKKGFQKLGHIVTIVSSGDGWKSIKGEEDIIYQVSALKLAGHTLKGSARLSVPRANRLIINSINKRFPLGIDLIIVINYKFLSSSLFSQGVKLGFIKSALSHGTQLIMSVCGGDPAGMYAYPEYYNRIQYKVPLIEKRFDFLLNNAHSVVPTAYSYYYAITKYCSMRGMNDVHIVKAIPLPITIDEPFRFHSCEGRKIIIFHGLIRPLSKGTEFIVAAMDRIQREFPERVKCVSKGKMPYDEYVQFMDEVDILVDQTFGNGWGMNAAIASMRGKCVLTPCGEENQTNMGIPSIPFVQIGPNSDQIYDILKSLILNPKRIDEIKKQTRLYCERYFECSKVAQKYLALLPCAIIKSAE